MRLEDELNGMLPAEQIAIAEAMEPLAFDEDLPDCVRWFAERVREIVAEAAEADQRYRHHGPEDEDDY